jgi:predicted transcriptional regulator
MKTLTMRVDDRVYDMIKNAANGQKRNISNFIEFATMQYLEYSSFISDSEMKGILNDKELSKSLKNGLLEAKNEEYVIV